MTRWYILTDGENAERDTSDRNQKTYTLGAHSHQQWALMLNKNIPTGKNETIRAKSAYEGKAEPAYDLKKLLL